MSGPNRPATSALRGSGLMPYASAATTAARPGPVIRRPRRQTPSVPNGSAPTMMIVRARPVAPSRTVPRTEKTPSCAGVGGRPGGRERPDEPTDAGPPGQLADRGDASEQQGTGPDQHQRREHEHG